MMSSIIVAIAGITCATVPCYEEGHLLASPEEFDVETF